MADAICNAQEVADRHDEHEIVGVYKIVEEFKPKPKPKMVTRDIDSAMDSVGIDNGYFGNFIYGILNQLKKDGVQTIEYPVRDGK